MLNRLWGRRYLLLGLVVVVAAGMAAREASRAWARREVAREHARHLAELSEVDAAAYVWHLAENDVWLDQLVQALGDRRPKVAAAAAAALDQRLANWGSLSSEASTPRVLQLSALLAAKASTMSPDGQRHAQTFAESLLLWPVDVRHPDAPQLMLDCETVLRLEPAAMADVRVAVLERRALPPAAPLPADESVAGPRAQPNANSEPYTVFAPEPPQGESAEPHPTAPAPLAEATIELPEEPKQFLPPRGIRISDE